MKSAAQIQDRDRILNTLFFLVMLIFIMIAVYVHVYPENRFDIFIQEHMHPLASPALLPFWIRISIFGASGFLFPAFTIRLMSLLVFV